MEFFCYHRDRPGSTPLRRHIAEQHLSYMDRYAGTMIARGPTFTSGGDLTGSVHILDLPHAAAARAFAFEEPGYQAGAYRDVLLRRWHNTLGRTMWDFETHRPDDSRYLVLGFLEPTTSRIEQPSGPATIACGPLLSDDGSTVLGAAILLLRWTTAVSCGQRPSRSRCQLWWSSRPQAWATRAPRSSRGSSTIAPTRNNPDRWRDVRRDGHGRMVVLTAGSP
jgi:uncharacterized protein